MPILVMCSNSECGELFDAPDGAAGGKVKCPGCGTLAPVPGSAEHSPDHLPDSMLAEPQTSPEEGGREAPDLYPLQPEDAATPADLLEELTETVSRDAEPEEDPIPLATPEPLSPPADASQAGPLTMAVAAGQGVEEAPPEPRQKPDDFWDELVPPEEELRLVEGHPLPESGVEAALENKWVMAMLFSISLLGMGGGVVVGVICFPGNPILAAFVGGCVGGVALFILSLLLVLGSEREEFAKVCCPVCFHVFPIGTDLCRWCGSKLLPPNYNPLTIAFRGAGSYALTNKVAVYWIAMLTASGSALFTGASYFPGSLPDVPTWSRPALIGLCAVVGFLIYATWLQFLLNAIRGTLQGYDRAPPSPAVLRAKSVAGGIKGLLMLAVYALPLFTVPLLPLGLLFLAADERRGAFNPRKASRAVWRHGKDFVMLWMWVLLWFSVLAFGVAGGMLLYRLTDMLTDMIPGVEGASGMVLSMVFTAIAVGIIAAVGCIAALAMCRCIGVFGRKNAKALFGPRKKTRGGG